MLAVAQEVTENFQCFVLGRVPVKNRMPARLRSGSPYFTTSLGICRAPSMDMSTAEEGLQKKSLRRHERGLQRLGEVLTQTFTRGDDILPRFNGVFRPT